MTCLEISSVGEEFSVLPHQHRGQQGSILVTTCVHLREYCKICGHGELTEWGHPCNSLPALAAALLLRKHSLGLRVGYCSFNHALVLGGPTVKPTFITFFF